MSHVLCFISVLTYWLVWLYVYIGIQEATPLCIYGRPYLRDLELLTANTLFHRNRHRLRSYIHLYTTNRHRKPTRTYTLQCTLFPSPITLSENSSLKKASGKRFEICCRCDSIMKTTAWLDLKWTHAFRDSEPYCQKKSSREYTATLCNKLQHTAAHCSTLQHHVTATQCITLHHIASHCNILQRSSQIPFPPAQYDSHAWQWHSWRV